MLSLSRVVLEWYAAMAYHRAIAHRRGVYATTASPPPRKPKWSHGLAARTLRQPPYAIGAWASGDVHEARPLAEGFAVQLEPALERGELACGFASMGRWRVRVDGGFASMAGRLKRMSLWNFSWSRCGDRVAVEEFTFSAPRVDPAVRPAWFHNINLSSPVS